MLPEFPELPLLPASTISSIRGPRLPGTVGISSDDLSLTNDRAVKAREYAAAMGRAWESYRRQVKISKMKKRYEERAINRYLKTKYSV